LRHADEVIGDLALLDVYGRVARTIRDLAQKQGQPAEGGLLIKERPTHQEIAGLIGTSRETVSRALNDFTRRGLLEMQESRFSSAGASCGRWTTRRFLFCPHGCRLAPQAHYRGRHRETMRRP